MILGIKLESELDIHGIKSEESNPLLFACADLSGRS